AGPARAACGRTPGAVLVRPARRARAETALRKASRGGRRRARGPGAPGRPWAPGRRRPAMRSSLALRELALLGAALLAAVAVLAVTESRRTHGASGPQPEGSYTALAASSGPAAFGRHTACGGVLTPDTLGVAHPTLPCGARIFVSYRGTTILTQVVDRGPYAF